MNALLWKEWRQAGPAHFLVAVVIAGPLLFALPPEKVLLPSDWDIARMYLAWAIVSIAEGFLVGLLQHARERALGTEAYLLHRGSGRLRAFAAKVLSGCAALSLAVSVPPLAYFLWHVVLSPSVENPLSERLGRFLAIGACSLPAYGLGAFTAQLRKGWWSRTLLGIAGCLSLLFGVASKTSANAVQTPIGSYLFVQVALASALLAAAFCLFAAGDDETRPWPRRQGLVAAAVLVPLALLPWFFCVGMAQSIVRFELLGTYPQIVEDADRALYFVQELPPVSPPYSEPRFELRSAEGHQLRDDRIERYRGFGPDFDPFLTVFDPYFTPIESNHPPGDAWPELEHGTPFGFDGAWIELLVDQFRGTCWLRTSDGSVHIVDARPSDEFDVKAMARHEVLVRSDTRQGFSSRTLVCPAWIRPPLGGNSAGLMVDLEDRTLWHVDSNAGGIQLERVQLPGDDELIGTERLCSFAALRAGLYDRIGAGNSLLLIGNSGRYLWTSQGLETVVDRARLAKDFGRHVVPESEASEVTAWRLEPSRIDGLGFQLHVFDVETNQLALSHDFRPESAQQKKLAALAWTASLLRAPAGSLWSFLGAQSDPRDVNRRFASFLRDPLLMGGAHPLLLGTSIALGSLLALSARRRLGRDPRDRAVRWTWTLAVFALGMPAWILYRMLEPSRRRVALQTQQEGAIAQPPIQSPRSNSALQPAMSPA